jgi:hypothetical protein
LKKVSFAAIILGFAVAAAFYSAYSRQALNAPNTALNAAFRDGIYQAKLDDQLGRKPSFSTGRWISDADRKSFLAGYEMGLESAQAAGALPKGAEIVGYRDGMVDGAEARRRRQPFALRTSIARAAQTRSAAGGQHGSEYLQAYANGYQYGYYGDERSLQSRLTIQKSTSF